MGPQIEISIKLDPKQETIKWDPKQETIKWDTKYEMNAELYQRMGPN